MIVIEYYLKRILHSCSFSMIKWFAYIALLLIFAPCFLSANISKKQINSYKRYPYRELLPAMLLPDTTKSRKQEQDDKKKIKEIAKTRKQPKPEKIGPATDETKRTKRQRRPDGLERPPEIPRRNGN
jgi:hypothetical protein